MLALETFQMTEKEIARCFQFKFQPSRDPRNHVKGKQEERPDVGNDDLCSNAPPGYLTTDLTRTCFISALAAVGSLLPASIPPESVSL